MMPKVENIIQYTSEKLALQVNFNDDFLVDYKKRESKNPPLLQQKHN